MTDVEPEKARGFRFLDSLVPPGRAIAIEIPVSRVSLIAELPTGAARDAAAETMLSAHLLDEDEVM